MAAALPERVTILGMPVDRLDFRQTIARLAEFLEDDVPRFVITADAAGMAQADNDPEHRALFADADLVTPDSVGVIWAAKRAGRPISERVSGVELVVEIAKLCSARNQSIFFLGAAPGIAAQAAERLAKDHPGLRIAGVRDGYFTSDEEPGVVAEIMTTRPDVLLVAMGIPRQEKFIARHLATIEAKINMGVGGSFDVISGNVKRAPRLVQRVKMEWLWRTIANPKKIAKAKMLPLFVMKVLTKK